MKSIIFVLFISFLFSLPRFSIEEGSGCVNCHVNPSGSGMRNDHGSNVYTLDELTLRKWISKSDEDWDGYITNHIQIGGEFRIQSFHSERQTETFPMQAELYTKVDVNKSVDLYFETSLDGSNYEYFILFNQFPNKSWIKLGKSSPNYGLMIDDHTAFIKSGNGTALDPNNRNLDIGLRSLFDPSDDKPLIIEGGTMIEDNMYLTMSISGSLLNEGVETLNNYTGSLIYNGEIRKNPYMIGASIMREDDFSLSGLFGGISLGKLTMTFETDFAKNLLYYIETSFASYAQLVYKPLQGLHFLVKYDYFDYNYNYKTDSIARISYGFEIFPLNVLELKLQVRSYESKQLDFNNEYLLQLHTWF